MYFNHLGKDFLIMLSVDPSKLVTPFIHNCLPSQRNSKKGGVPNEGVNWSINAKIEMQIFPSLSFFYKNEDLF